MYISLAWYVLRVDFFFQKTFLRLLAVFFIFIKLKHSNELIFCKKHFESYLVIVLLYYYSIVRGGSTRKKVLLLAAFPGRFYGKIPPILTIPLLLLNRVLYGKTKNWNNSCQWFCTYIIHHIEPIQSILELTNFVILVILGLFHFYIDDHYIRQNK